MPDSEPVAQLRLGEHVRAAGEAMRLWQAAEIRRTDRRPLSATPVPPAALAAVRAAVEAEQVSLHPLRDDQVSELAVAAARADELSAEDDAFTAELACWVGGQRPEGTGLPDTAIPMQPLLAGLGHPYLVLRLGLADPDHPGPPHTPRLPPTQTIEIVDGDG